MCPLIVAREGCPATLLPLLFNPFPKIPTFSFCLHIQQRKINTTLAIISAVPSPHVMRASVASHAPSRLSRFPSELSYKVWQCLIPITPVHINCFHLRRLSVGPAHSASGMPARTPRSESEPKCSPTIHTKFVKLAQKLSVDGYRVLRKGEIIKLSGLYRKQELGCGGLGRVKGVAGCSRFRFGFWCRSWQSWCSDPRSS